MNLEGAKQLFRETMPEETKEIENKGSHMKEAGLVWHGFKAALKATKTLEE